MRRLVALSLLACSIVACAGKFEGQRGDLANPLQHIGQSPELFQHLPILQQHPAPLGPAMDAYPVVEPPEVKRVWIVAHDNANGDRISGHYVDVLYQKPRFAPIPGGTTRIPVAPQLAPVTPTNPTSGGTLAPHDYEAPSVPEVSHPSQQSRAQSVTPQFQPGTGVPSDLIKRLEEIRKNMLGSQQGSVLQNYNSREYAP